MRGCQDMMTDGRAVSSAGFILRVIPFRADEMSKDHTHVWKTRYITLDHRYDCASGMECECGARLDQDDVEVMVNELQEQRDIEDLLK